MSTVPAEVLWNEALAVLRAERGDGWEVADAESQLGERRRRVGFECPRC